MRKGNADVLEMFQDPLLTIIALILLCTVWMIIPKTPDPIDPRSFTAQNEIDSLKISQQTIDKLLQEHLAKVEKLQKELEWLESEKKMTLEAANESEQKNALLDSLKAKLESALNEKREEIRRLEQSLPDTNVAAPQKLGGGSFTVFKQTDKQQVLIEIVNDRLFPVDDDHYDAESGHYQMKNGSIERRVKATRKSNVRGEDMDKIESFDSAFQKLLRTLNTEEKYIVFLLHSDSFAIFRKAREIAITKGFEIGWWPYNRDAIIFGGSGGGKIGSTGPPQK